MTAILNCYGIASESNFTEGFRGRSPIPLDIIAGNEWNDTLRQQFEKANPRCRHSYKDMRMMLQDIKDKPTLRNELHGVDIMTATPPCFGRTVLREENGIDSSQVFKDDDLFRLQLV